MSSRGPDPLGRALEKVVRPLCKTWGDSRLLTEWENIVGKNLAAWSAPAKLIKERKKGAGAVLHVQVYASGVALEMQHMEPAILERIATYLGYRAVGKLKLIQCPMPVATEQETPSRCSAPLSEKAQETLHMLTDDVAEPTLKKALEKLGTSVLQGK